MITNDIRRAIQLLTDGSDGNVYLLLRSEMKKVMKQWKAREGLNIDSLQAMADIIKDEPEYTYHQRIDISDKEKAIRILGELDALLKSLENRINLLESNPANRTRESFARAKGMIQTIIKFQGVRKHYRAFI